MKPRKLFTFVLCLTAGLLFTSCLNNDDDNDKKTITPLTPQQRLAQLADMQSIYSGKVFFTNDSTQLIDSISGIDWSVLAPDSTLTLRNLPMKVLAHGLPNTELKQQLLKSTDTQSITADVKPFVNESNSQNYYTFWVLPKEYKSHFTVNFGDTSHEIDIEYDYQMTVALSFYYASMTYYSTGEYYNRQMVAYFLVKSITCDGSKYYVNRVFFLKGEKA